MTSAREEILLRIRAALADQPAAPPIPREYRGTSADHEPPATVVDRFAERVSDYRAEVHRTGAPEALTLITRLVNGRSVVVPDGFPGEFTPRDGVVREPLTTAQLDGTDAVLTTCALGIAETGTLVLDHTAGQGRRALTLVPDHHICVIRSDQVVASVPDAIAALDPSRPLTFISGPSATSDIELNRVEGVHGPRRLDVVLLD